VELVLCGLQRKTLSVAGDSVQIEKKGILTGARHKTLAIRNITSVEVKKPGAFSGFIQFSIAGGKARDSSFTFTGGAFDAAGDENSVMFTGQENYDVALSIKAYIESWPAQPSGESHKNERASTVADEIRSLKALLDDGLLTPDEFNAKKKQLLGI
jgi:hypothetical protein